MKHYGYFGAAIPDWAVEAPPTGIDMGDVAEAQQLERERRNAYKFGDKCPELLALSAEARELARYLYHGS